ncbi:apolipoprotein N-acyltransferase [Corynebacterium epidermidicanis]|uniref:Apolipoprotein N-acyltransferase n=1 Tax=Corynebacterium epidermidicanis TaxID=1050174 RepID=A0A0G3GPR1_9CORY|nr:apolipoprotein N-acyltransferase [Corynebacterium epidermidicanis]AKK03114.1 apolipoprotein N-acyltransferase [Corynebacterium epidermidicanis]
MIQLGRIALSFASGFLLYCSYEPLGWWWAAILGIGVLFVALCPWRGNSVSWRFGALLGGVHALGNYLFLLPWVGEFVGKLPYVALSVMEATYSVAFGALATLIIRHTRLSALWFAAWYVTVEYVRSSWPFNGFAWVRLAWGQVEGPLAHLAAIGGPALVTFVVALLGATLASLSFRRSHQFTPHIGLGVVGVAAVIVGLVATPNAAPVGEVTVAAVQGNVPRLGLDFNAQRRAVLANHARETSSIQQPVDLVIWPENSSDVNPFADAQAAKLIDDAIRNVRAPILVGTILSDEVGDRNTMQVFRADGSPGDYHYKKYLQPFGEYMPYRDFFRQFSDYVDLAGDFKPGSGNGTVHMTAAQSDRDVTVGIATCYEVAFDAAYRSAVRSGAQILATPTNNATFGFTDMTYQQLAMSRMRAIELDRAVVIAATSGASAIVLPDGSVTQQSEIFTHATLIDTLPLRDTVTVAARFGQYIELTLVALGVLGVAIALVAAKREPGARRRQARQERTTQRRRAGVR